MTGKSRFNFWLDVTILALFLLTALTGLVLWLALPHVRGGQGAFLTLARATWRDLHAWVGLLTLAGLAAHIVLHRRWITCVARRYFGKTTRQARLNFSLNSLLFVSFGFTYLSGLVSWLVVPAGGYQGGRNPAYGATWFGLDHHAWSDIHLVASLLMVAIFLVHLALHWKWLAVMARRYRRPRYSCAPGR